MADAGMRGTDEKNARSVGRNNNRRLHLPKSDVPSVPESRGKPGSDKPTLFESCPVFFLAGQFFFAQKALSTENNPI